MISSISANFNLSEAVEKDKQLINEYLEKYLEIKFPNTIWESMRYTTLSAGKRIRAVLALESARACGGKLENVLPTACALEMLHAQSLIHDDLPCMDDDDYRRGVLSNHKVYGEATAVLAGDALLAYAPQVIIKHTPDSIDRNILLQVLDEFLHAAGPMGIVGGQIVDIQSENKKIDFETFNYILNNKTGELFKFALRAGVLLSNASKEKLDALTSYGQKIGYAFQIADDILDVVGSLQELGKTPGKDNESGKNTYVSVYGLEKAVQDLDKIILSAQNDLIDGNIESLLLKSIASYIVEKVR
ncbi:MAG TPA: polyprenyl synthetase family protein [Candidatus Gastranaerophilales bacterium]|nr:polyprenyl synthetase family protein [Candidatus Gastranaerophilales bacterium]